jgi:hypothetical protein
MNENLSMVLGDQANKKMQEWLRVMYHLADEPT